MSILILLFVASASTAAGARKLLREDSTDHHVVDTNVDIADRRHKIYLLGNSVVRHYSFSIVAAFLKLDADISRDRAYERDHCGDVLGTNHCSHRVDCGNNTQIDVSFLWKMYLSKPGDTVGLITDARDVCKDTTKHPLKDETNENCLTTEFKDASKSDLLIVQSPAVSYWGSGLVDTFEKFAATYNIDDVEFGSRMLLKAFPGKILYISFTQLSHIRQPTEPSSGNKTISALFTVDKVNNITCAGVQRLSAASDNRLEFVDLNDLLLRANLKLYNDIVHHPGLLSLNASKILLSKWGVPLPLSCNTRR